MTEGKGERLRWRKRMYDESYNLCKETEKATEIDRHKCNEYGCNNERMLRKILNLDESSSNREFFFPKKHELNVSFLACNV